MDTASSLFRTARRYDLDDLSLSSLDDFDIVKLLEAELAIFVVSTTGNGDIPKSMMRFWTTLLHSELGHDFLEDLNFIVIGMGDSKYAQFNWTAKKLRRRLIQLGAQEIIDIIMCDDSAHNGPDTALLPFLQQFEKLLLEINGGKEPRSRDVILPALTPVVLADLSSSMDMLSLQQHDLEGHAAMVSGHQIRAKTVSNDRLTSETHFQDARLIKYTIRTPSDFKISPGDVLSFVPSNSGISVSRFLDLLGWMDEADQVITSPVPTRISHLIPSPKNITLRQLVRYTVPLHGVPSPALFAHLRQFTDNEDFREKFDDWETAEGKDDLYDYLSRPRRTLLEIIEDFASGLHVPIEYCIDVFGTTVARSYSIAGAELIPPIGNTGCVDDNAAGTSIWQIDLLVAMIKYQTKIKEARQGYASRYLMATGHDAEKIATQSAKDAHVDENPLVNIESPVVQANKMPIPQGGVPILLICTGTGFAPLRYLLKYLTRSTSKRDCDIQHDITLFFGCRSSDDDLVAKSLPEGILQQITIIKAFSRESKTPKTYVQDLVSRNHETVQKIVQKKGIVYLCGSSGAMPDAVRAAVDACSGDGTVKELEDSHRWWQETW